MELNKIKSKRATAIAYLEKELVSIRSITKKRKQVFLEIIKEDNSLDVVIPRGTKNPLFKLEASFFKAFIKKMKIEKKSNDDKEYTKMLYTLKRRLLIHPASSNFPKALSLVSINKNHNCLISNNYGFVDQFIKAKKDLISDYSNTIDMDRKRNLLYIYFRIFHIRPFSVRELKKIKPEYILEVNLSKTLILFEADSFVSSPHMFLYELEVLDKNLSEMLSDIDERMFTDFKVLEKELKQYIKHTLEGIDRKSIQDARHNEFLFNNKNVTPLDLSIRAKIISTARLTLLEVDKIYPEVKISEELLEKDRMNVKYMHSRPLKNKKKKEDNYTSFDITELEHFRKIISNNNKGSLQELKTNTIADIKFALKYTDKKDMHTKMIMEYVLHEVIRLKEPGFSRSTFRSYFGILNNHLFSAVEDLNNIENYELDIIIRRIQDKEYKKSTTIKIRRLLKHFFIFHNRKNIVDFDIGTSYFPKSFVMEDEFIKVLNKIKEHYKKDKESLASLQMQTIAIIEFIGGLRKTEIQTRELGDIFMYKKEDGSISECFIDVNPGKFIDSLKSDSAKRLIKLNFDSPAYSESLKNKMVDIFNKWYEKRIHFKGNKSSRAFLKMNKERELQAHMLEDKEFLVITEIIKNITKRYCTSHSLRHSFATYKYKDTKMDTPYKSYELSGDLGHATSDISYATYVHVHAINL
jgi:integrase